MTEKSTKHFVKKEYENESVEAPTIRTYCLEEELKEIRPMKIGRYTIVTAKKGDLFGVGIARKSDNDKQNRNMGVEIAKGRALKAIKLKEQGKPLTSPFMG